MAYGKWVKPAVISVEKLPDVGREHGSCRLGDGQLYPVLEEEQQEVLLMLHAQAVARREAAEQEAGGTEDRTDERA